MLLTSPLPNTYWVIPGQLIAGDYPGAPDEVTERRRLEALLDAGVTLFIDLTEAGEYDLRPYAPQAGVLAAARGRLLEHRRMSIPDLGTPSPATMRSILDAIDAALAAGRMLYVHCYAGVGRTGTVVGCHLVRHGRRGAEALEEIAERRSLLPRAHWRSPETDAQRNMVLTWREA